MSWVNGDTISAKVNGTADDETGVTLGGHDFAMPPKLPLAFPLYLQREDIHAALACLFGEGLDNLLELAGTDLSVEWLREVVEQVYGDGSGEASASSPGSKGAKTAGKRARPTSSATTG